MPYLEHINTPADLKALPREAIPELAKEIRDAIIEVTSAQGGHIGPNLGVVELTLALHRVFNAPSDRFIFDVSHQGYVHKLLTGRAGERFEKLRQTGGISGFLSRDESDYDHYGAGHAGTALSAALGMAAARDLRKSDEHIVAIIGDAALTCGITMEALNNIAVTTKRLIVVLNDNEWSIARNVGAIARYLNELITTPVYNRLHDDLESFLHRIPGGESIIKIGSKAKQEAKDFIVSSSLFEKYGLRYIGPIDGHDIDRLSEYLEFCKQSDEPIVLHVLTTKGQGYPVAISQPERFHGTSPFDIVTGKSKAPKTTESPPAYQDVFGKAIVRFASEDLSIVGITAAMPSGTGLSHLAENLPDQFFDVGIAEEHAVLFAAGLATQGIKPVCAIYSTFLQRAYDPIIHDICLQNLPVVFAMDRAGLSPNDGPTHHGLFDIAYLRCVPESIIMQPADEDELVDMLWTGLGANQPVFLRYPKGAGLGVDIKDQPKTLEIGKAGVVRAGSEVWLWALGPWVAESEALAARLAACDSVSVGVVNARFAKPIDIELLIHQAKSCRLLVTLEDHILAGGFGSAVIEALHDNDIHIPVLRIGWPDRFVSHGSSVDDLRRANGLDRDALYSKVSDRLQKDRAMLADKSW